MNEPSGTSPALSRNPISAVGAWITTLAAFSFIAYFAAESFGFLGNPYAGLLGFVAIPACFVAGLLLIPIGMWWEARRRRRGAMAWAWPSIDLNQPRTRRVLLAVSALTVVNFAIVAVAGLGATHYMESDRFCGLVCHEPMRPEFTAHQEAPHAGVMCAQCHVGPGGNGMVRAKLNGTRQAYEFLTRSYNRPIPSSPARNIPVAADTCLRCHSNTAPPRDTIKVTYEYANDKASSETVTALIHFTKKNHWHTEPGRLVEYVTTDPKRGAIPYVKVTETNGAVTEYFGENVASMPSGERRTMDCMDCHSRPAHRLKASAEQAVDDAIGAGQITRSLPFVRRELVAAMKATYPNDAAADEGIRTRVAAFYKSADASKSGEVDRATSSAIRLYHASVFPEMKITWGTYVSHIGHSETDGCFRCHDDSHKSRDGRVIKQDCDLCHRDRDKKDDSAPDRL